MESIGDIMDLYMVRKQLSLGIPLTNLKLRVTDYCRVSTDNIKQKNSLNNQINYFEEMIKNNNNWIYIDGYVDEGITGTSDIKRDNFMRMIEDGKSGKFDLIITKEISRFSRNTLDSIKYTRELLQCGVAVFFVNDNINTALPDSELRLTIMASMAQDEIRRLSERVKFGMNRAIIDGHILGNDKLFGYNKNKITGNLEINEIEGEVVKKIYDMYVIDDMSLSGIVCFLNNSNIKTSMNKKFSVSTLSRMLRNPKYKGYYCGKKTEIIDYITKRVKYIDMDDWIMYKDNEKIPPLVNELMWDRAFEKLNKRSNKFGSNKVIGQKKYVLSSRLVCDKHNTLFYRRKLSKNSDEVVWRCSRYYICGKNSCDNIVIRESELYFILDNLIDYLGIDLNIVIDILLKLYLEKDNNSNIQNKLKIYNSKKANLLRVKDKILELNILGLLSDVEFGEKNSSCNLQLVELEDKINDLILIYKKGSGTNNRESILKDVLRNKVFDKDVLDYLIEKIINKIIVSSFEGDNINLIFYFNLSIDFIKNKINNGYSKLDSFFCNDYVFNRGCGKKKCKIKYNIECYIC